MILACPNCATDYFVAEDQISPAGRVVRCVACGATWMAAPALTAETPRPTRPKASDIPRRFREKAGLRRRLREAALGGAGLGAAALSVALGVGAAMIWRGDVVGALPATAGVYAALGLPVNRVGLVIEAVSAEPALEDGHAALAVYGTLRNVVDRQTEAPPLRIVLYNVQGQKVAARIATPPGLRIPAGGEKRFAVAILDPPLAAHNLEVSFAEGRHPGPVSARPLKAPPRRSAASLDLKGALPPPPAPTTAVAVGVQHE